MAPRQNSGQGHWKVHLDPLVVLVEAQGLTGIWDTASLWVKNP